MERDLGQIPCADPESFVRGGSFFFFLVNGGGG